MSKLVPFTAITRRKLIKLIRKFGEAYYVFTDGSDYEREENLMRDLEVWPKDQLQNLYRDILYTTYSRVLEDPSVNHLVLVCFVEIFASSGVQTPDFCELPTCEGMKLVRDDLLRFLKQRTIANSWEEIPYFNGNW